MQAMTQAYSDPERASDPHALPDIELWPEPIKEIRCKCGVYDVPASSEADCPVCESPDTTELDVGTVDKWWYWHCLPGCLPASDVHGPFHTEQEALKAARDERRI